MGKESRCYNPEGQRARGPEGQRARGPEGRAGVVMSWVLPLVGCGGPAVSRCGHETRRHRVRGALFASVFASVLLAACGGGSGGNLTTSSEREPGPPGPGPLTATGGGGNESEEEQQQKTIVNQEEENEEIIDTIIEQPEEEESEEEEEQQQEIVVNQEDQGQGQESENDQESDDNNEEQPKIVVNIQPPEESNNNEKPEEESESESENDQESDDNNNEETPQQLTIIEEPPYIPPAKVEPQYSASTGSSSTTRQPDCMTVCHTVGDPNEGILSGNYIFSYGIWLSNDPTKNAISFLTHSNGAPRKLYWFLKDQSSNRDFIDPIIAYNKITLSSGVPDSVLSDQFPPSTTEDHNIQLRYYKKNGFEGAYLYDGQYGHIRGDVDLMVHFYEDEDMSVTGSFAKNVTMNGHNFNQIFIHELSIDYDTGLGQGISYLGYVNEDTNTSVRSTSVPTTQTIKGAFVNNRSFDPVKSEKVNNRTVTWTERVNNKDVTRTGTVIYERYYHAPNRIVGEVKLEGFRHTDDTTSTASKNALYGVFVGEVNGRTPKW